LPMQSDGTTFYYSDYNNSATKFFHQDKWPCCSGTFPQITADYGISSYFRSADGIYVNLFVPSEVTWQQEGARCSIEQRTQYPVSPEISLRVRTARPATFAVYLRVPAWASPQTSIAINGRGSGVALKPGSFVALHRQWKDGDRIEYTIDMPLSLEAVDPQHPNEVALLQGPLALFAVGSLDGRFRRAQLLQAKLQGSTDWSVPSTAEPVVFRPFNALVKDQKYRLYQEIEG
jgi:uncharacterized protein